MPRRPILILAALCILIAVGIVGYTVFATGQRTASSGAVVTTVTDQPSVGGPFQLVNQDGASVDQSILNGKWTLVFFGFTYCPDYCPTTLGMLEATQRQLGDDVRNLQIVFVSVDPARDTPQVLKDYLSSDGFPRGVIGLTGTQEQVTAAAAAYRAPFARVGDDAETYTMQHGLTIYLMGPDGRFRTALAHDLGPDRAATVIRNAMARG